MKKLTQLIKITPQVSGGGLRLQLHNHFGDEPLGFDRLEVSDNEKMQGAKMITRGGQTRIVIASHGTAQTDTLPFQVTAGQPLYFRMCATCNQSYVDLAVFMMIRFIMPSIAIRQRQRLVSRITGRHAKAGFA